jgi:carbamoyl-phosphate synthase large subunit
MSSKRVFLSGGAGVIGGELIPKLLDRGYTILTGDLKPRPRSLSSEVLYRQGDLNSMTSTELEAFAPEIFIHLAATFERSTETYAFWEENFWHNVRLSHHLMTLAKDLPSLHRITFASSYLIYNPSLYQFTSSRESAVSLSENDPIMPRNLTGMAKLAHELELEFLQRHRSGAFSTVCARIFRGYGRNSRDIISRWVRALLDGEEIDIYRPEGMFDYVYAKDTAEGLLRLTESTITGIVNLGTGQARRVQEVVDLLRVHFPEMCAQVSASDIAYEASQADMEAFQRATGWLPEYDLESAIPEIIAHERTARENRPKQKRLKRNVLVTSSSQKVPLLKAVKDAAGRLDPAIKVIAGDLNERALTRFVADDFWIMPAAIDENFEAIVTGCIERDVAVIIPTRDGELAFWARKAEALASKGIDVIVSPLASIEVCVDKLAFWEFGHSRGLPFIQTSVQLEDINAPSFVVKERYGAGSRSLGLDLDAEDALSHSAKQRAPLFQPFIKGAEISVDAWMDQAHQVKGLVLRRRDEVKEGESRVTTTFRDVAIEKAARSVLTELKLRGPVVLQAILAGENHVEIIECNARFGGASTASIAAGLDIFYWTLLESFGGDMALTPFNRIPGEIRQVRMPTDIYFQADDPGF